jgi:hypothetical protein
MRRLERTGYGAMFCDLFSDATTIVKCAKNEEGSRKLRRELAFYKIVKEQCRDFPIVELLEETNHSYTMHFYKEYSPLYQIYWNTSVQTQNDILNRVESYLTMLHRSVKVTVSKEEYLESLLVEVYTKPLARVESIRHILRDYSFQTVNGVELDGFHDLLQWIKDEVLQLVQTKQSFDFCLIHGDCQFNNILYNPDTKDLIFLDPRGYFGQSELFGPIEYDSAKLLFALSGYDIFDTMEVSELKTEGNILILPSLWRGETIFKRRGLETYLFLAIWLSNAHSFLSNPKKVAFSYYYALYVATLVKRSVKDEIK